MKNFKVEYGRTMDLYKNILNEDNAHENAINYLSERYDLDLTWFLDKDIESLTPPAFDGEFFDGYEIQKMFQVSISDKVKPAQVADTVLTMRDVVKRDAMKVVLGITDDLMEKAEYDYMCNYMAFTQS